MRNLSGVPDPEDTCFCVEDDAAHEARTSDRLRANSPIILGERRSGDRSRSDEASRRNRKESRRPRHPRGRDTSPRALVTKAYMEASWQGGPVFTICSSKWFVIVVREGFTSDRQKVGRLENETMTPAVAMST